MLKKKCKTQGEESIQKSPPGYQTTDGKVFSQFSQFCNTMKFDKQENQGASNSGIKRQNSGGNFNMNTGHPGSAKENGNYSMNKVQTIGP